MSAAAIIPDELPTVLRLALAYALPADRPRFAAFFALDARLARQVARAKEPILAQLPLAWWRDELGKAPAKRAARDPLLQAISRHWPGEETALIALVDGWESLCLGLPDKAGAASGFAGGRGKVGAALARLAGCPGHAVSAEHAARRWALAELACTGGGDSLGIEALALARDLGPASTALPRSLRPLVVLDGLARSALARGGAPLLGRRRDFLAVMRLGMTGR